MRYRIDRAALDAFVARQVDLVESTPLPNEVAQLIADTRDACEMSSHELVAVWLGAGLATQIGLALLEAPERFITGAPVLVAASS